MVKKFLISALFALSVASPASPQTSSTQRTLDEVMGLLGDNTTGAISPQDLRDAIASIGTTGWSQYADTQYPCVTPFTVPADVDTVLPNNAGSVISTYRPSDVTSFYDGSVITGRNGDGILITVDLVATPTSASTTFVEIWFDIGGAVGELYRRIISFPKGNGVDRPISFTVAGYTLDTWDANGATVYIRANGSATVCNIRYVITRTHRGGLSQ